MARETNVPTCGGAFVVFGRWVRLQWLNATFCNSVRIVSAIPPSLDIVCGLLIFDLASAVFIFFLFFFSLLLDFSV